MGRNTLEINQKTNKQFHLTNMILVSDPSVLECDLLKDTYLLLPNFVIKTHFSSNSWLIQNVSVQIICEQCPNFFKFFLVRIFRVCIQYRDLRSKSSYSVLIRENKDQKTLRNRILSTHCMLPGNKSAT